MTIQSSVGRFAVEVEAMRTENAKLRSEVRALRRSNAILKSIVARQGKTRLVPRGSASVSADPPGAPAGRVGA